MTAVALEGVTSLLSSGMASTNALPYLLGLDKAVLHSLKLQRFHCLLWIALNFKPMEPKNAQALEPCGFAGVAVSFLGTSAAAANSNIVTSSTEPLEGAPLVLQLVTGAKVGGEANGA